MKFTTFLIALGLTQLSTAAPTEASLDPRFEDNDIVWTTATSTNGHEFEVGSRSVDAPFEKRATGPPYAMNVSWPVMGDTWQPVTGEMRTHLGISQYKLYPNAGLIYKYILKINNYDTFNYFFRDEEGDSYQLNTWTKGEHYVRYNSDKPKIVYVVGF